MIKKIYAHLFISLYERALRARTPPDIRFTFFPTVSLYKPMSNKKKKNLFFFLISFLREKMNRSVSNETETCKTQENCENFRDRFLYGTGLTRWANGSRENVVRSRLIPIIGGVRPCGLAGRVYA